jgi:regulator of sigma E protease
MDILSTTFYFLVVIGILVLVHELGHFLAAKFFGMRVDRFSIGFPPRAFGKKIGDTDYCVSWIPIGGYVKIAGMIDESFDTAFVNEEPKPWEFRAKPIWQRMIVICAGVTMNIFLAVLIFWGIIFYQGKSVRPVTEIGYVVPESPSAKAGFQPGDVILRVNNKAVSQWEEIENLLYSAALSGNFSVEIKRGGQPKEMRIGRPLTSEILESGLGLFPAGTVPLVTTVESGKPADVAGIKPGDIILAVNGEDISYHSLQEVVKRNAGKEITLRWKRK